MNSIRRKLIGLFPKIAGSYITISTPHSGAQILIGETLAIAGTTDFADGATVSIYAGATLLGTTTVSGGAFSYSWTADGEPGSMTLKAVCGSIEDSVDITLAATIVVIEPVENQSVTVGVAFDVSVQSGTEGDVNVYIGNALIATIPIVEGMADGTAVIPDNLAGVGSAFIVDGGGETPAGGPQTIPLRFVDASGEATVNVKATLGEHFVIGTAEGSMGFTADRTVTGEFTFDAAGQIGYTPEEEKTAEFVLDAEGSVTVTDS